jgi:hypothetical protein
MLTQVMHTWVSNPRKPFLLTLVGMLLGNLEALLMGGSSCEILHQQPRTAVEIPLTTVPGISGNGFEVSKNFSRAIRPESTL